MKLAVVCNVKMDDVFETIKIKSGYRLVKVDGVECVILDKENSFEENLEIAKEVGVEEILEVSESSLSDDRELMAKENGISYTGFFVKGKIQYVKPLLSSAIAMSKPQKKIALTNREQEVLELVADGLPNKEIAKRLFLSEKTVKNHLNNIFKKIEVSDRTNAALYAIKARNI